MVRMPAFALVAVAAYAVDSSLEDDSLLQVRQDMREDMGSRFGCCFLEMDSQLRTDCCNDLNDQCMDDGDAEKTCDKLFQECVTDRQCDPLHGHGLLQGERAAKHVAKQQVALSSRDLHRAKTLRPRDAYRGDDQVSSALVLNGHLRQYSNTGLVLHDCDAFSSVDLHAMLQELKTRESAELLEIYQARGRKVDPRHVDDDQVEFVKLLNISETEGHDNIAAVRDALCHDAVLAFVHYLPEQQRSDWIKGGAVLPYLPVLPHDLSALDVSVADKYKRSTACAACHV